MGFMKMGENNFISPIFIAFPIFKNGFVKGVGLRPFQTPGRTSPGILISQMDFGPCFAYPVNLKTLKTSNG
jgi:hypothetical protein